ncbi:MAG: ATP-binding protein [Gemmatimonadales bacterium]|nr:ATP-binding protein [Gemmatimonadales bacterium]
MNINKLFRSLPIRAKLTIAFGAWATVPVAILGVAGTVVTTRQIESKALKVMESELLVARERSEALLSRVRADLAYFAAANGLADLTSQPRRSGLERLAPALQTFLRHKPDYYRVLLVAADGHLLIVARAERTGRITVDLEPDPVEGLYYGYVADRVPPGQVGVQPLEVRGGEEVAPVAVVAFVQPLAAEGHSSAAVVLEFRLAQLADLFRGTAMASRGVTAVATSEGLLLYHSQRHRQHRSLLAAQPEATIYADLPRATAERVVSGMPGVDRGPRSIVAYVPFRFAGSTSGESFVLYHAVPRDELFAPARRLAAIVLGGGAVFLALALWLAVIAARQLTGPIRALRERTRRLAQGLRDAPLPVATNDELEDLGRDFTEMARQLQLHTENLESLVAQRTSEKLRAERLAAVGTLAAGVAHEINNPCGIMLNRIECVAQEVAARCGECFALRDLDVVRQNAMRVATIARGLLDLSRDEEAPTAKVSLGDVVARVADFVGGEFHLRGVALETALARQPTLVAGNESRLEQLVLNLLLNALQATPLGGRVRVGVATDGGRAVVLEVQDTGCGIPQDALERIFDPFYSTRRNSRGTGLGLAVVQNIAAGHRARILVESEPGNGSTFRVMFPPVDRGARP